jgi:mono/diheme cytochrome c family protein
MRFACIHAGVVAIAVGAVLGSTALVAAQAARPDPLVSPAPPGQNAPTFSRDVAPIFYSRCVSCHRPGEIGPMSFVTYQDVRPWAKSIREKVSARVMPPWFADPHYGKFRNDRSLSDQEIQTIVSWVNAGARQGNPADMPPVPKFPAGWQIGTPDVVYELPVEFQIPVEGTIEYQYFEVPTNFTEDKWMQAGEVRAGDSEHVHHIIVSVIEPGKSTRPDVVQVKPILAEGQAPAWPQLGQLTDEQRAKFAQAARRANANMVVNWAVGEDAPVFQNGMAKRIPAGSTLLFQIHYTTNGAPGKDRSKVALIFAKEPPQREIRTGMILNPQFAIPPGAADHQVESEATFTDDVKVWSMHPHMHLRGKDMTYTATYPDGRSEIVLRVPKYDFGWQTDYWLTEPLALPKGSKLHVTAHFDNSPGNPNNPNPKDTVRWGDQTWEEMMIGFFTYTVDGRSSATAGGGK